MFSWLAPRGNNVKAVSQTDDGWGRIAPQRPFFRSAALFVVASAIGVGVLLALPVLVFGAGPDTPQDQEVVGLSWEAGQGRTVFVAVLSGYCIGQPKPTLEVRKNEPGAGAKFPRGAVVLEAVVKRPDSSSAAQPEFEPGQPVPICNGLALRLTKTVRLNRPIGDRPVLERLDGQLRRAPKLP